MVENYECDVCGCELYQDEKASGICHECHADEPERKQTDSDWDYYQSEA